MKNKFNLEKNLELDWWFHTVNLNQLWNNYWKIQVLLNSLATIWFDNANTIFDARTKYLKVNITNKVYKHKKRFPPQIEIVFLPDSDLTNVRLNSFYAESKNTNKLEKSYYSAQGISLDECIEYAHIFKQHVDWKDIDISWTKFIRKGPPEVSDDFLAMYDT